VPGKSVAVFNSGDSGTNAGMSPGDRDYRAVARLVQRSEAGRTARHPVETSVDHRQRRKTAG